MQVVNGQQDVCTGGWERGLGLAWDCVLNVITLEEELNILFQEATVVEAVVMRFWWPLIGRRCNRVMGKMRKCAKSAEGQAC